MLCFLAFVAFLKKKCKVAIIIVLNIQEDFLEFLQPKVFTLWEIYFPLVKYYMKALDGFLPLIKNF